MDTNRINRLSLEGDMASDTVATGVCREIDGVRIYLDSELGDHIASMLKSDAVFCGVLDDKGFF